MSDKLSPLTTTLQNKGLQTSVDILCCAPAWFREDVLTLASTVETIVWGENGSVFEWHSILSTQANLT